MRASNAKRTAVEFGKTLLSLFLAELLLFWSLDLGTLTAYAETVELALPETQTAITAETTQDDSLEPLETEAGDVIDGLFAWGSHDLNEAGEAVSMDAYAEYHYRDSYFYNDPSQYNASLATMSMCLAMSAFNAVAGGDDYSYKYVNLDNLLTELGFSDLVVNDGFTHKPTRDSIGVGIASKEMTLEDGSTTTLIAIAVRGGGYGAEWASNVSIGGSEEAGGFSDARNQVVTLLNEYLANHEISENPKFWIVGFSRASATANLTANYLNYCMETADQDAGDNTMLATTRSYAAALNMQQSDLFCYGFEVPAGGIEDTLYPASYQNNIWCLVNSEDVVPLVAPSVWGFYRYGQDVSTNEGVTYNNFLTQLSYVSKKTTASWPNRKIIRDGGFQMYSTGFLSIIKGIAFGSELCEKVDEASWTVGVTDMATYVDKLITYTASTIHNRKNYAENLQGTIAALANLAFCASSEDMANVTSTAKKAVQESVTLIDYASLASKVSTAELGDPMGDIDIFHFFHDTPEEARQELKEFIGKRLKIVYQSLEDNSKTNKLFTENDFSSMVSGAEAMASFLYDFIFTDYRSSGKGALLIGTALYYSGQIIDTHMQEPTLAYLRAKDPNYTTTLAEGRNRLTISAVSENALDYVQVNVKLVDTEGDFSVIGTATKAQGMQFEPAYRVAFKNKVKLTETAQGDMVITADYGLTSADDVHLELEIVSSGDTIIQMNYHNINLRNTRAEDPVQWFEYCDIPLYTGGALTISCLDDNACASVVKTVPVHVSYLVYDAEATGKYSPLGDASDDFTVSLNTGGTIAEGARTNRYCTATIEDYSDEYDVFGVYKYSYDSNGMPVINNDGFYSLTRVSSMEAPGTWSIAARLYDTTEDYVVVCAPQGNIHAVSVSGKLMDKYGNPDTDFDSAELNNKVRNLTHQDWSVREDAVSAATGDVVKVTYTSNDFVRGNKEYRFIRWAAENGISDIAFTSGDLSSPSFTFVMPDHDVNFEVLLVEAGFTNEPELTITTTSGWAAEETITSTTSGSTQSPTSLGWETLYVDSAYSSTTDNYYCGNASHVYGVSEDDRQTGAGAFAYLEAPAYRTDAGGNALQFDHWIVYDSSTAKELDTDSEAIAVELVKHEEDDRVYYEPNGAFYCPNGSTNQVICIASAFMHNSIVCIPVYKPITYSYEVTLTDGTTLTGTAAPGETVSVADAKPNDEYIFDNWSVEYAAATYQQDVYYNWQQVLSSKATSLAVEDSTTLSFIMPEGNVTAQANSHIAVYKVDVESGGSLVSGLSTYQAGEVVSIKPALSNNTVVEKWVTVSDDVETDLETEAFFTDNGIIDHYTFVMPNHPITIKAITSTVTYTLTLSDATAQMVGSKETIAAGTIELDRFQTVQLTPETREGYTVNRWALSANDPTVQIAYVEMDGSSIMLSMPACNITASPVYTASGEPTEKTDLATIDLTVGSMTGGAQLPAYATASDGLTSSFIALNWDFEGSEALGYATSGNNYQGVAILRPDSTHLFVDNTAVTINGQEAQVETLSDGSLKVMFNMTATEGTEPDPSAGTHTLTVINGTGSGTYVTSANTLVSVAANTPLAGTSFTHFEVNPSNTVAFMNYNQGDSMVTFTMPDCDVTITACYRVEAVELSCADVALGQAFPAEATVEQGTPSVVDQKADGVVALTFATQDGKQAPETASCGIYVGTATLTLHNAPGYSFAGNCTAKIGTYPTSVWGISGDSAQVSLLANIEHQLDSETGACANCGATIQASAIVEGTGLYEVVYAPAAGSEITEGCATYQGEDMVWLEAKNCWATIVAQQPTDLSSAFGVNKNGTVTVVASKETAGATYGDVNASGTTNIVDAQAAYDLARNCYTITAENLGSYKMMLLAADVDTNLWINASDAFAIQYAIHYGWN